MNCQGPVISAVAASPAWTTSQGFAIRLAVRFDGTGIEGMK